MRTLEEMAYDDARATIAEAQEIQSSGGRLTLEQGQLVFNALKMVSAAEGTPEEKLARRERYHRRKQQTRDAYWDRWAHE